MPARDPHANADPATDSLPITSESWSVPEAWKPGIAFADLTDVGMRRANNQDSHVSIPAKNEDRFWQRGHLFIVADGMGAHAAGELASRMATELIALNYFRNTTPDAIEALRTAVHESNREIYQRGQQNPEFHNMGTTASTLAIVPEGAILAHVGDSRIYRLRRGVFEQLTFDHSLVWEMEASGQVAPNSAHGSSHSQKRDHSFAGTQCPSGRRHRRALSGRKGRSLFAV